ncbi:MAG: tannase/feruloyl esterase family alpha/beta hydrolase [Candidatus Binataceae bacterium]
MTKSHYFRRAALIAAVISLYALPALAKAEAPTTCDTASIQDAVNHSASILSATPATLGAISYCQVDGRLVKAGDGNKALFEIGLPDPLSWNSRLLVSGNGGFAGGLSIDTTRLQDGYAVAATNSGHQSKSGKDASWALHNGKAVKNFDYLAVHTTAAIAQTIISAYYVTTTKSFFSYFDGCSTGGRQGLVEASKYPADFNGIVAGDPNAGNAYLALNWNESYLLQGTAGYIDLNAATTLDQAVLNECDGLDGVVDGLIQDPSKCGFNVSTLLCAPGQTGGCLSADQVATIQAFYQGPVDTKGKSLYPGLSPSDPVESASKDSAFADYLTGCRNNPCNYPDFSLAEPWAAFLFPPDDFNVQDAFLKYFVFQDANYDSRSFSFSDQKSINKVVNVLKKYGAGGTNANLKAFAHLNHKLLIYHGWSDPAFSPFASVNFFNSAQANLGAKTTDNVRLFMVPGMHHCQGFGPGPNTFDELTPMVQWVEQGIAPDGIIATHYANDDPTLSIDRTMPLCSYPEIARYDGVGPLNDASSWACPSSATSAAP